MSSENGNTVGGYRYNAADDRETSEYRTAVPMAPAHPQSLGARVHHSHVIDWMRGNWRGTRFRHRGGDGVPKRSSAAPGEVLLRLPRRRRGQGEAFPGRV